MTTKASDTDIHSLNDEWCIWAHLPHDTDWSLKSYKVIHTCKSIEEVVEICAAMSPNFVKNCMLFVMRKGITPLWEDVKNRQGGCFSYKLANKQVYSIWKNIVYAVTGEFLSNNISLQTNINGVTISPKKNFCILKVWMKTCDYQNPNDINTESGVDHHGCLFRKHTPEY